MKFKKLVCYDTGDDQGNTSTSDGGDGGSGYDNGGNDFDD